MTREEAIIILGNIPIDGKDKCYSIAEYQEAKTMAIEALKQEPYREIEDYENEIEDLHNRLDIAEYDKERFREEVINLEEKIKTLEQEPKSGHWKIIPSNNNGEYRPRKYACSECGWEIDLCRGLQQDTGHRLFCEHCGAKMFEPQESEDK